MGATQGKPVVRPLFWDFLEDDETHSDEDAVENEIMLGDAVLVRGICKPMSEVGESATVYLPKIPGGWYDLYTGDFYSPGKKSMKVDMKTIPAFYRAGVIVPLKSRIRRSSTCMHQDPFTIAIYLDPKSQNAQGHLYIDDYKTQNYTKGQMLDVMFKFSGGKLSGDSSFDLGPQTGSVATEIERVEIYGLPKPLESAKAGDTVLAAPVSRQLEAGPGGEKMYMSTVKVVPWVDLSKRGWVIHTE